MADPQTGNAAGPAIGQVTGERTPWLNVTASPGFCAWLQEYRCSLAFTSYQSGKLFFVGRSLQQTPSSNPGLLSVFERNFPHCMGMCSSLDGRTVWVASRFQIWRLEQVDKHLSAFVSGVDERTSQSSSASLPSWAFKDFDKVYIPRIAFTTGYLDVHDLGVGLDENPIFVNTLFNCLSEISVRASFRPIWRPPFVSELIPEDRCHLNGLAMDGGKPAFVSVASCTDIAEGWRKHRTDGGAILSVDTGETVLRSLSMPHSPRVHQGKLWFHNSGSGEFCSADMQRGTVTPVCFAPGYLRGLSFRDHFAVMTLSKPRHSTFQGLPLDSRLKNEAATSFCGILIVNLRTGRIAETLELQSEVVSELYDVVVLPDVRRPMAMTIRSPELEQMILVEDL